MAILALAFTLPVVSAPAAHASNPNQCRQQANGSHRNSKIVQISCSNFTKDKRVVSVEITTLNNNTFNIANNNMFLDSELVNIHLVIQNVLNNRTSCSQSGSDNEQDCSFNIIKAVVDHFKIVYINKVQVKDVCVDLNGWTCKGYPVYW